MHHQHFTDSLLFNWSDVVDICDILVNVTVQSSGVCCWCGNLSSCALLSKAYLVQEERDRLRLECIDLDERVNVSLFFCSHSLLNSLSALTHPWVVCRVLNSLCVCSVPSPHRLILSHVTLPCGSHGNCRRHHGRHIQSARLQLTVALHICTHGW